MPKLLIVAYEFPPYGGAGVQRVVKFCKYLTEFGIETVIFTKSHNMGYFTDDSFQQEAYFKKLKVYRYGGKGLLKYHQLRHQQKIRSHPYYYYLALKYIWFMDFFSSWYFEARHELLRIADEEQVDCIFSTAPPFSVHLFGAYLKRQRGIPWIADMRDSITGYAGRAQSLADSMQITLNKYYEKKFCRQADAITVVSPPMRAHMIERLGDVAAAKTTVITNGYDPDDFVGQKPATPDDCFVLTHTGSFRDPSRSTKDFVNALKLLARQRRIKPDEVFIRFVGYLDEYERTLIESLREDGFQLDLVDFVSYQKVLAYQHAGSALLLIATSHCGAAASEMLTGKVFEYMYAERPIFALAPDGPLKNLIEQNGFGLVVSPCDVEEIAAGFEQLYRQWQDKQLDYAPDASVKKQYHRRVLASQLADLVKQVIA